MGLVYFWCCTLSWCTRVLDPPTEILVFSQHTSRGVFLSVSNDTYLLVKYAIILCMFRKIVSRLISGFSPTRSSNTARSGSSRTSTCRTIKKVWEGIQKTASGFEQQLEVVQNPETLETMRGVYHRLRSEIGLLHAEHSESYRELREWYGDDLLGVEEVERVFGKLTLEERLRRKQLPFTRETLEDVKIRIRFFLMWVGI